MRMLPLLFLPALLSGDVDNLEYLGSTTPPGLPHRMDCEIVGDRAYLSVATSSSGLEVYDISDPADPVRIFAGGPSSWRSQAFGDTLLASFCRTDGVTLFDISGSIPVQLGQYNPPGAAEALEGGDLAGDILYCAAHQNGIYAIDVSNPANPQKTGEYDPGDMYAWNLVYSAPYLFVANGRFGLSVIDTQGSLQEVATLALPGCANDVNLDGDILAVSLAVDGIATVDVSDPLNPFLRDLAPTGGCLWGAGVAGHLVAAGSWYLMETFDISNPDDIVRTGWDNTFYWAHGADVRSDSLIGAAAWSPMLCYSTGEDPGADIDVEPQLLDFGPVSGSRDTTVVVMNTGSGTLDVGSISMPSGFTATPGTFSLAPGTSQAVTVTATGSTTTSGYITYNSNDPDEPARTQEVYRNSSSFPQYGSLAPDFTLEGTDGIMHTLSDYRGRVIYLEFGGAW
jgi:hypothetical protein